jgi:hypothetical protein
VLWRSILFFFLPHRMRWAEQRPQRALRAGYPPGSTLETRGGIPTVYLTILPCFLRIGYSGSRQGTKRICGAPQCRYYDDSLDLVDTAVPFLMGDEAPAGTPGFGRALAVVRSDLQRDGPPLVANLETTHLPFSFCCRSGWL